MYSKKGILRKYWNTSYLGLDYIYPNNEFWLISIHNWTCDAVWNKSHHVCSFGLRKTCLLIDPNLSQSLFLHICRLMGFGFLATIPWLACLGFKRHFISKGNQIGCSDIGWKNFNWIVSFITDFESMNFATSILLLKLNQCWNDSRWIIALIVFYKASYSLIELIS